jgi:plastocyanin
VQVRVRLLPLALIAGFLVAVLPALAADRGVTASSNVDVTVSSNQFTPKTVTINQGDTVTWTNSTGGDHNVHFDDNSFEMPSDPDTSAWKVSRTFNTPGKFGYYCEQHGGPQGAGMSGVVIVNPSSGTQPTTTGPGLGPLGGGDKIAPAVKALGRRTQHVLRQRAVLLGVQVSEASTLTASGTIAVPGGRAIKLSRARRQVGAGATSLKLKLSGKRLAAVRRALRRHRRLTARLTVTARDAAGNAGSARRRLKLLP